MAQEKLKADLKNSTITFDVRRLLTDLHDEYALTEDEINEILLEHIKKEESRGTKFLMRFLVSGDSKETKDEIFTIVEGKTELERWLQKLEDAEWSLYSLEIAGGAKAPAQILNPVKRCTIELKDVKTREFSNKLVPAACKAEEAATTTTKKTTNAGEKRKAEATKAVEPTTSSKQANVDIKKSSPKEDNKKKSPEEKKNSKPNAVTKKGISDFFGPKRAESKPAMKTPSVIKPPTPKKIDNFFKKQAPSVAANRSIQLFDDDNDSDAESQAAKKSKKDSPEKVEAEKPKIDSPEKVEIESSDDEEELRAIRLDLGSDHEASDAEDGKQSATKRRRICDSDEEDEDEAPQSKHEKKDVEEEEPTATNEAEEEDNKPELETYLDEEGFVVTVKSKTANKKVEKKPAKPTRTTKSPAKAASSTSTCAAATTTNKTKQGSITSFFQRK